MTSQPRFNPSIFLPLAAIVFWGCALTDIHTATLQMEPSKRPNIVLVTADDLGFQLGCYGDKTVTTPNLDRLAEEGTRFTRAYVTQASCSPSRSSILTGLYPHQNGQIGLSHLGYSTKLGLAYLPSLLKAAGYNTGIIGKLHVGVEEDAKFDYDERDTQATRDPTKVREMCGNFLKAHGQAPFFLYVNFFDPHEAFHRDINGSPKTKVAAGEIQSYPFMGKEKPHNATDVADFATCVNRLDECFGELMAALREKNLAKNTLIIFLGDNGPPLPRAKFTSYEAGVLVPQIAWWPDHIKKQACDELVSNVDIMPTLLQAAGLQAPTSLAGVSLWPLLEGQRVPWREYLATEFTTHEPQMLNPQRSIRNKRYKLTLTLLKDPAFVWPEGITLESYRKIQNRAGDGDFIELYDLATDPCEFQNIANKLESKAIQDELTAELQKWRIDTQDPLLDQGALRDLVVTELDAPSTEVLIEKQGSLNKEAKAAGRPPVRSLPLETAKALREEQRAKRLNSNPPNF